MGELRPRFQAIDVARGMTVALMIIVNRSLGEEQTYAPLLHARWHGLTLTDLVFPTFLFMVGASLSFSLQAHQRAGHAAVLRKVLTRAVLIFLCGYLLSWLPFAARDAAGDWTLLPFATTRLFGVLQRIALAYAAGALIVHAGGQRAALGFALAALVGYWAVLAACGDLSLHGNAVLKLDRWLVGDAHLYHGEGTAFDPEGLLSTLPAIVNVLAGYLAGRLVRTLGVGYEVVATLFVAASACIVAGLAWSSVLPLNKKLWTSSYVLVSVGIDCAFVAVLLYVIDLKGRRGWTGFFEVFGRNTLFAYVLSEIGEIALGSAQVGDDTLSDWLYLHLFSAWAGARPGALLYAFAYLLACWLVVFELDRRRWYLKL